MVESHAACVSGHQSTSICEETVVVSCIMTDNDVIIVSCSSIIDVSLAHGFVPLIALIVLFFSVPTTLCPCQSRAKFQTVVTQTLT